MLQSRNGSLVCTHECRGGWIFITSGLSHTHSRTEIRFDDSFQDGVGRNNKSGVARRRNPRECHVYTKSVDTMSLHNVASLIALPSLLFRRRNCARRARFWRWSKLEAVLRLNKHPLISQYIFVKVATKDDWLSRSFELHKATKKDVRLFLTANLVDVLVNATGSNVKILDVKIHHFYYAWIRLDWRTAALMLAHQHVVQIEICCQKNSLIPQITSLFSLIIIII